MVERKVDRHRGRCSYPEYKNNIFHISQIAMFVTAMDMFSETVFENCEV